MKLWDFGLQIMNQALCTRVHSVFALIAHWDLRISGMCALWISLCNWPPIT